MYYKIWDWLCTTMGKTYFPVTVFFNDVMETIEPENFEKLEKCESNERYMLRKLPDYGMEIWDKQTCTRVTIGLISENDLYRKRIYFFKGMENLRQWCLKI